MIRPAKILLYVYSILSHNLLCGELIFYDTSLFSLSACAKKRFEQVRQVKQCSYRRCRPWTNSITSRRTNISKYTVLYTAWTFFSPFDGKDQFVGGLCQGWISKDKWYTVQSGNISIHQRAVFSVPRGWHDLVVFSFDVWELPYIPTTIATFLIPTHA